MHPPKAFPREMFKVDEQKFWYSTQKLTRFPLPSDGEVVYCDASCHATHNQLAFLAILCGNKAYRIRARAKNANVAELLAILMARKLFPGKLIVNDCLGVVTQFQIGPHQRGPVQHLCDPFRKLISEDACPVHIVHTVNSGGGVMWKKRRSDPQACLVDSLTRRDLGRGIRWCLEQHGYDFKEIA